MNINEFSNQFDTLINAYSIAPKFGNVDNLAFDEYEKSVFLTNAQEEIIIDIYSGKNIFGDSFEKTEEIRRYLSELIETYETDSKVFGYTGISKNSVFYEIPKDVWFITYESATLQDNRSGCFNGEEALIVPVTQDNFYKVQKNPFRGPSKTRILRLDNKGSIIELVSEFNISRYLLKYITKPSPIILTNLNDGLSINGINIETECKLNPVIHRAILERAVQMAIQSRVTNTGKE